MRQTDDSFPEAVKQSVRSIESALSTKVFAS